MEIVSVSAHTPPSVPTVFVSAMLGVRGDVIHAPPEKVSVPSQGAGIGAEYVITPKSYTYT